MSAHFDGGIIRAQFAFGPDAVGEHLDLLMVLAVVLHKLGGSVRFDDAAFTAARDQVDGVVVMTNLRTMKTTVRVTYLLEASGPSTPSGKGRTTLLEGEAAMVEYHLGAELSNQGVLLLLLVIALQDAGDGMTFDEDDLERTHAEADVIQFVFDRNQATSMIRLHKR
jgi:hypothetical protein